MNYRSIFAKCRRSVAVAAVATAALAAAAAPQGPRYVFLFIGDGMGMAPIMATEAYNRLVHNNANPLQFTRLPVASWAQSWSASSPVTDSAAAGTAIATGSKTNNGMVGMNADTVSVTSMARELKDNGYGVGLVTNCAADDATPAAFYAHQPKRSMYYEIGKDAAVSGYDFICGASMRGLVDKDGKATDLAQIFSNNGVELLRGAQGAKDAAKSKSKKIILVNPQGYGDQGEFGYEIDNVGADGVGLTLSMAMDACLKHLEKNSPKKFFMMVEGGLIDHALHGNDATAAVREVQALDACVQKALAFYKKHPNETLILITADHNTGGLSVGCKSTGYNAYVKNVDYQKMSKSKFSDYCVELLKSGKQPKWEDMKNYLAQNFGFWTNIKIKEKAEKELEEEFYETFVKHSGKDEKGLYKTANSFAKEVFEVYADATGWGYTTTNHTGDVVPVFAIGKGAEQFGHMLNNTDLAPTVLKLTGVKK